MKATPGQQKELLRVQELDTRILRLENNRKKLPQDARLAELRTEAEAVRHSLAEATRQTETIAATIARLEADTTVVAERLTRDDGLVNTSTSVKDVEALESEIVSLRRRRDELEEHQLEAMEELEEAEKSREEIQTSLDANERETAELDIARQADLESLGKELELTRSDRTVLTRDIDPQLLALYERQRDRYGVGAAALEHGINRGSNLALAPSDLAAALSAPEDDVIIDAESGAILVRDEHSGR